RLLDIGATHPYRGTVQRESTHRKMWGCSGSICCITLPNPYALAGSRSERPSYNRTVYIFCVWVCIFDGRTSMEPCHSGIVFHHCEPGGCGLPGGFWMVFR